MRNGIVILVAALVAATACKKKDEGGGGGGGSGTAGPAAAATPVDKAKLDAIAKINFGDAKVDVLPSKENALQLKIAHTKTEPAMTATLDVGPCKNCLPMDLTQWQAHAAEMRALEDENIRDKEDTVFEIGDAMVGSTKTIYTHTAGLDMKPGESFTAAHNYTLYWNDGVNQVRVKVKDASLPSSQTVAELLAKAPKEKLAAIATETLQPVVAKIQGK